MERDDARRRLFSGLDDIWMETKWDRDDTWDVDEAWVLHEARDGVYTYDDEEDADDWDNVEQKSCSGQEYAGTEMMFEVDLSLQM